MDQKIRQVGDFINNFADKAIEFFQSIINDIAAFFQNLFSGSNTSKPTSNNKKQNTEPEKHKNRAPSHNTVEKYYDPRLIA